MRYGMKVKNFIANNANLELKNVNSNGNNVVASNLSNTNYFFVKIVEIKLKNKHYMLFILKDVMNTKFLISFTSLINIE
jgi:hypothetical protein